MPQFKWQQGYQGPFSVASLPRYLPPDKRVHMAWKATMLHFSNITVSKPRPTYWVTKVPRAFILRIPMCTAFNPPRRPNLPSLQMKGNHYGLADVVGTPYPNGSTSQVSPCSPPARNDPVGFTIASSQQKQIVAELAGIISKV
jgi:hypothetical protein